MSGPLPGHLFLAIENSREHRCIRFNLRFERVGNQALKNETLASVRAKKFEEKVAEGDKWPVAEICTTSDREEKQLGSKEKRTCSQILDRALASGTIAFTANSLTLV